MTITSVNRIWFKEKIRGDDKGIRRWSLAWRLISDDPLENPLNVLAELPQIHDPLAEDPESVCRELDVDRNEAHRGIWVAVAEFNNEPFDTQNEERRQEPNPTLRPPVISWSSSIYQKPINRDRSGHLILNSAGNSFDPPPTKEESRWVIHVKKNYTTVPTLILTYQDTINDNDFVIGGLTVTKNFAKFAELQISEKQEENGYQFYIVEWNLHLLPETWQLRLLDEGFHQKHLTGGYDKITVGSQPVSSPWPLDGNGFAIADPTPNNAVYLTFLTYKENNFALLPGCSAPP
jgi:hypothetical protein